MWRTPTEQECLATQWGVLVGPFEWTLLYWNIEDSNQLVKLKKKKFTQLLMSALSLSSTPAIIIPVFDTMSTSLMHK